MSRFCDFCGEEIKGLPFKCRHCGLNFCPKCRLPEIHHCTGYSPKRNWNVFSDTMEKSKPQRLIYHSPSSVYKLDLDLDWGMFTDTVEKSEPQRVKYHSPSNVDNSKHRSNKPILGPVNILFSIVFIAAIFGLYLGFSDSPSNQSEEIQENNLAPVPFHYETEVIYLKGNGEPINLNNNPYAINPTYQELKSFLYKDDTDKLVYTDLFVCADFAETLHNNAEGAGYKCGWVAIYFDNKLYGHACNVFETTDKGLVFIDCTGDIIKDDCYLDSEIKLEIGEEYRHIPIIRSVGYIYERDSFGTVEDYEIIW